MSTEHWNYGVAGVGAQNTNEVKSQHATDTPQLAVGTVTNPILDTVEPSLYGGEIPAHSQHWADYLGTMDSINPMGSDAPMPFNVNVEGMMNIVQNPQHIASGGSSNPWDTFMALMWGPMRNGHNTTQG